MNNFRDVKYNDFEKIKELYKKSLNFDISRELYDYFYKIENQYCSTVYVVDDKVIAHNAIIPKKYILNEQELTVGLSSGGMVDPDYSGVFFNLLRYSIKNFGGDAIIAFPNKNSEPFFTKLLKFNLIAENYFGLKPEDLNLSYKNSHISDIKLSSEFINHRVNEHPKHNYTKIEKNETFLIYKEFNDEIDLIYISAINSDLIRMLKDLFDKGCREINLIYGSSEIPTSLGFRKKENNVFTYKWLNTNLVGRGFNCQMIDSDIF